MYLKKVELENFMPFYLNQEIDFTSQGANRIIILQGGTGRGKSSTFVAMSFALYGLEGRDWLEGPDGKPLKISDLVNLKRMIEANGTTSVTVHFQHNGDDYTFKRKISFKKLESEYNWKKAHDANQNKCDDPDCKGLNDPEKNCLTLEQHEKNIENEKLRCISIPSDHFSVTINGTSQTWDNNPSRRNRQQKKLIDSIVPGESNRYYFFDGEDIKSYTIKPPEENIKTAIEKILGIKMLDNAIEDLRNQITEIYNPQINKLAKSQKASESYAKEAEQAKADITHQERQIITNGTAIRHTKTNIKNYEDKLNEKDKLSEILSRLTQAKTHYKIESDGVDEATINLANYYSVKFPILLAVNFLKELNDVTSGSSSITKLISDAASHWLEQSKCQCDRPLDQDAIASIQKHIKSSSNPLEHVIECKDKIFGEFGTQTLDDAMATLTGQLSDHLTKRESYKREIKEIETELTVEADEISEEIKNVSENLALAKLSLETLESEEEMLKRGLENFKNTFQNAMTQSQLAVKSPEMLRISAKIFRAKQWIRANQICKDKIVETQVANIEDLASQSIRSIAPESGFRGIKLDKTYTLMIDTEDFPRYTNSSPRPSEGQKQALAMAFVLALTHFAGTERPIFIDTPFGRLDNEYTLNIARRLVDQPGQIIILYQPGEVDDDTIDHLISNSARHYRFTKIKDNHCVVEPFDAQVQGDVGA